MITSWRLVAHEYMEKAFEGTGAQIAGGRWSTRGHKVVYTASSAALATLELFVHIEERHPFANFVLFACSFDETLVTHLDRKRLPEDWRTSPAPAVLQELGDDWIRRGSSAVLEVPSAVIPTESNFLLNPLHPDFPRVEIREPIPFPLDLRLLRR